MHIYHSYSTYQLFLRMMGVLVFPLTLLILFSMNLTAQVYQVYVAAESDDVVQRVSFDANTYQGWVLIV